MNGNAKANREQLPLSGAGYIAPPIAIPSQDGAGRQHRATEIAAIGHLAKCSGAASPGAAGGEATHGRGADADMIVMRATETHGPARSAQEVDQRGHGSVGARRGAGLAWAATVVALARGNPGNADMRPLGAPNRAIAIGNKGWSASE